jgi:hypothetical protein
MESMTLKEAEHENKRRYYPISISSTIKPEAKDERQLPFSVAKIQ